MGKPATASLQVVADWDDVRPAVLVSVGPMEMAVVDSSSEEGPRGSVYVFDLTTIRDEPARLVARTSAAPGGRGEAGVGSPDPVDITLEGQLEGVDAAARVRALLERVAKRLRQLRGVATAPMDAPQR